MLYFTYYTKEVMALNSLKIGKSIFICVFMLLCFSSFVMADQGTTGAVFLKLEQGVRPISMGGAFTAAADDVNAILWNPAGLSQLKGFQATFMHTIWFADIFYDYLAMAYPAGEIGTFGLSVVYVNSGDIQGYGPSGEKLDTYSATDLGISLAYGTDINCDLSLGVTIKTFFESIKDASEFGFAGDLGGIYKIAAVPGLSAGITVQNLGPQFGFGESFTLPITFKFGFSYTGIKNMMLNLDYIQPIETYGILAAGMEYWYRDLIALRLGYQFQGQLDLNDYYANYAGPKIMAGFVIGMGVKIDIYSIDYAFRQFGVFENTHRLGLTLKFK